MNPLAAAVVVGALALTAAPAGRTTQAPSLDWTDGTVASCRIDGHAASVQILSSSQLIQVDIADAGHPGAIPVRYAAKVGGLYEIDGRCPAVGERIRLTRCRGCGSNTIDAIELWAQGPAYRDTSSRLLVFRQYFDLSEATTESAREAMLARLFFVSALVARHNLGDGGSRSVWLRDRLDRSLFTYSSSDRAAAMVTRFGANRPGLRASIDRNVAIRARDGAAVGLVRGLPFMPPDRENTPPFVGSWGVFALDVYVEEADGRLEEIK